MLPESLQGITVFTFQVYVIIDAIHVEEPVGFVTIRWTGCYEKSLNLCVDFSLEGIQQFCIKRRRVLHSCVCDAQFQNLDVNCGLLRIT